MEPLADIELTYSVEEVVVHEWRAKQLEHLGISRVLASAVAHCVDWHDLAGLIARGCPPNLAVEILR